MPGEGQVRRESHEQRRNTYIAHGTRRLPRLRRIRARLRIFTPTPRNLTRSNLSHPEPPTEPFKSKTHNVGRARPRLPRVFVGLLAAPSGGLEEPTEAFHHAAHVAAGIRRDGAEEAHAGFGGQIGLLDLAFG